MPIPTPTASESQSAFVSRCISFLADEGSSLEGKQRVAACYTSWRRAKGVKASEDTMPDLKIALFEDNKAYSKIDLKLSGIKLWRKQVLRFGKWKHPENKDIEFEITPVVLSQIIGNFNAGVPTEAPVVLTHSDNPLDKVGNIKSLVVTEEGLDAIFSVDGEDVNTKIAASETAPGVSCWVDLNYVHKETGDKIGAVLKHVALVNHPYIEGMAGFEAVLSEAEDGKDYLPLVYLSEKDKTKKIVGEGDKTMTKEELIAKLKEEHSTDVAALLSDSEELKIVQDKIEKGEFVPKDEAMKIALSDEMKKKIREAMKLSEDEEIDIVKVLTTLLSTATSESTKLSEAEQEISKLKETVTGMEADRELGVLLSEGFLFPAEKDAYRKLYLSDKESYDALVKARKESGKVVKLSEEGTAGTDEKEKDEDVLKRNVEAAKEEGIVA